MVKEVKEVNEVKEGKGKNECTKNICKKQNFTLLKMVRNVKHLRLNLNQNPVKEVVTFLMKKTLKKLIKN